MSLNDNLIKIMFDKLSLRGEMSQNDNWRKVTVDKLS